MAVKSAQLLAMAMLLSVAVTAMAALQDPPAATKDHDKARFDPTAKDSAPRGIEVPVLADETGAPITSLKPGTPARDPANVITRPPPGATTRDALIDGPWGDWTSIAWCGSGRFLNGLSVRNEGPQGLGDDTALNAVAMTCASKTGQNLNAIWAHLGYWGDWSNWAYCRNNNHQIIAVRAAQEPPQGLGDDTATNAVEVCCGLPDSTSCEDFVTTGVNNGWGSWSSWSWCPLNTAACGLQVKVEAPQGAGDDTAMNGINVLCCSA